MQSIPKAGVFNNTSVRPNGLSVDLELIRKMILNEIGWPASNRHFVSTVAALSFGRQGFWPFGHELMSMVLGYTGSDGANSQRVRRDLLEYERAEITAGRRLFSWQRGGGKEKAVTQYGTNYLNLAAMHIEQMFRTDVQALGIPSIATIQKLIPSSLSVLPRTVPPARKARPKGGLQKCRLSMEARGVVSGVGALALELASKGFSVVPLHSVVGEGCSCKFGPTCPKPGKHPRIKLAYQKATPSEKAIIKWWQQWPEANIGIRTGVVLKPQDSAGGCGTVPFQKPGMALVVIDIDRRNFGHHTLRALVLELGESLPQTFTVRTGDGWHFYFLVPIGAVKKTRSIGRGFDIKSCGGIIVAPGSTHRSGKHYEVERDLPIEQLPELFVDNLFETHHTPRVVAQGERHDYLVEVARACAGEGSSVEQILFTLRERLARCEQGGRVISETELDGMAKWAYRAESEKRIAEVRVA